MAIIDFYLLQIVLTFLDHLLFFGGIMQTVQTQFRRHRTRRLSRVYSVCLYELYCILSPDIFVV